MQGKRKKTPYFVSILWIQFEDVKEICQKICQIVYKRVSAKVYEHPKQRQLIFLSQKRVMGAMDICTSPNPNTPPKLDERVVHRRFRFPA